MDRRGQGHVSLIIEKKKKREKSVLPMGKKEREGK